jgi:hypothetical protein
MRVDNAIRKNHLRRHAAAMAIASTLCIASTVPMAAVIDSGPVNLSVPVTLAGIYLNLVTNASGITSSSTPGWDFNPFSNGGNLGFFTTAAAANISNVVGSGTVATALTPGATIGPASTFATTGIASTAGTAFRNTGTEYVGVRFNNEATGLLNYGYMELQTSAATGFPATIKRYVYENTGLPIIIAAAAPTIIFGYNPGSKHLVSFDATTPGTLLTDVLVTGLLAGENLVGLDFRPSNGLLYAVASTGVDGTVGGDRLVTIDTSTGAVTAVNGPNNALTTSSGISFGFDFNPVPDRIRQAGDAETNRRIHPFTGSLAATDTPLAYAAADPNFGLNPNAVHIAYSNNTAGATTTTLFGIDSGTNSSTIGGPNGVPSPNGGQLTTIGPLGVNPTISVASTFTLAPRSLMPHCIPAGVQLYTVNLATGAATLVGTIGGGLTIDGLSVAFAPAANLVLAQSRKVHAAAGTFDLLLSAVSANPTTEPG